MCHVEPVVEIDGGLPAEHLLRYLGVINDIPRRTTYDVVRERRSGPGQYDYHGVFGLRSRLRAAVTFAHRGKGAAPPD